MEFPHLGDNCAHQECNILDFLPVKCDGCHKVFCKDHFNYMRHNCESANRKNRQVPECPLCNIPVPLSVNDNPDFVVSQHIDNECQSDPAKARRQQLKNRKIYKNACTFQNCKNKEIIPVVCNECRQNFCLRHRHESDHNCKGKPSVQSNPWRNFGRNFFATFQGNLTEEEAVAKAVAESKKTNEEDPDYKFAKELQEAEIERRNRYLKSKQQPNQESVDVNGHQKCLIQ